LLGQGSQGQTLALNRTGAQLTGKTLVWAVATATLDVDPTAVDVTVELDDAGQVVGRTPPQSVDVSPEGAQFFVAAQVGP
jgi:hypothetical protein